MKDIRTLWIVCIVFLLSITGAHAGAESTSPIQTHSLLTRHAREVTLDGQARYVGHLPATRSLRIDIVLPLPNQAELKGFLQQLYDPSSPSYRRFLTVQEFTARFGPSQADYDAVIRFAKANGLTVVGGSRDGMDVQLVGSVGTIERAFHVTMGVYQHPTENRTFYAPDREPTVALPFQLWHISGLDNYSIPHPLYKHRKPSMQSNATTGSGPSASYLGSDMRAAYYGGTALTGSGQNIGLLEYYGYNIADLNTYYANVGQTRTAAVTGISTDGTSLNCLASHGCDDTEQIIDMTQALGMAPGITNLYVYVGSTDTAILSAMTTDSPLPLQLSCSWGWMPADPGTDDPYYEKMAAQGQSFFVAAGDSDEWTETNYPYPAEDGNVTTVGGTDLTTSSAGGAWSSETGWVDGGGGISPDQIAIPSWQQLSGVINSSNQGSTTYRNGPDVSANANFSFYVCADQTTCTANEYGGTSFAAPMWAGYVALVNQQAVANGNSPLGFINPAIYALGLGADYDTDFHDITSGNNGFPAVVGYDLDSGWGSPNGTGLIKALAGISSTPDFSITSTSSPLTFTAGTGGTSNGSVTVGWLNGLTSPVALTCGGASGITCLLTASSVRPGSPSSNLTITVPSTTPADSYSVTITGTTSNPSLTHSTTIPLMVSAAVPDFSISPSPGSLTVTQGWHNSLVYTLTEINSSSKVTMSVSGLPSRISASFSSNPVSTTGTSRLTITASSRAKSGTYSLTVKGNNGSNSHTANLTLTIN